MSDDEQQRFIVPDIFLAEHQRQCLDTEARTNRMNRLLDSLSVEGLLALRDILHYDPSSPGNNYWDGQIVAILRLVHGVDPETGLTAQEQLELIQQAS